MLKYLEVESKENNWKGAIYIKVTRETKCLYITQSIPGLGVIPKSYIDRQTGEFKWYKKKAYHLENFIIKNVIEKVPHAVEEKIYGGD